MHTLYIALGSNLGNRKELIEDAINRISAYATDCIGRSSLYETTPEGFESEHNFLNAVVAVHSNRSPEEWLTYTQQVERDLGRQSKSVAELYADRPIDIDLLMYDTLQGNYANGRLVLPHPRMHLRRFVLEPLSEIAPELQIPGIAASVRDLLVQMLPENL